MTGKIITGILTLFYLSLPLHAQTREIDSLKELLTSNTSDTLETKIATELAKKHLFTDPKESLRYAYLAYEAALKSNDPEAINKALLQIGNVYSLKEAYNTAIEYYHTILGNIRDCQCPQLEAETSMFLGQTYNDLKEYDSALVYLRRAKNMQTVQQSRMDSSKKNTLLLFLGEAEMNKKAYDTAFSYITRALTAFRTEQDTSGAVNAMNYLARYWDHLGKYEKEKEVLKELIRICRQASYYASLCKLYHQLAATCMKMHNPSEAIVYLRKSMLCLKMHDQPEVTGDNLALFSEYYAAVGNYQKAIDYSEKHIAFVDSLQEVQLNTVKELFDIRYDMETKIKSLSLLKRDNSIRNLTYKKNLFYKNMSRLLLIFFALIFLILFSVFLINKRSHRELLETNRKLEAVHKKLEQKQQQQQQENQIRNKLFMILAHDLINPFNALLGFAELLSEEIHNFERKDIKRHSEFIFQAAKQLHFLLENLLHWARIQTGRIQFQPAYIDLNKTIRDAAEVYRYSAEKKKITLMVNTTNDLIVYADESLISVVLRNLIHNAIKYTSELGVVTVEASRREDHVVVSVTDTGCGIPEEDKKKLFNLEHHFTRKGTSGEEGTGLGLIICKEFLTFHSSFLAIESTPDEGSRFSFILPVKDKNT